MIGFVVTLFVIGFAMVCGGLAVMKRWAVSKSLEGAWTIALMEAALLFVLVRMVV